MPERPDFRASQDMFALPFNATLFQSRCRISGDEPGVQGERENAGYQTVDSIRRSRLAAGNDAFDQRNNIGARNGSIIPLAPFRQDVNRQVALVLFSRAGPLMAV